MEALEYVQANQDKFLAELIEFLSMPSISTLPEHKSDIHRAASWLCDKLLIAGFTTAEVMPTPGHPVVYAEWMAAGPKAPTVLIYGHYDVQPADPLELWDTPPFTPAVVGDNIIARGAADDKGQLYIHVKAVEAFKKTGNGVPPVNVKCIFEGEEETGSPNLEPFVHTHADMLAADVAVISDTHMLGKGMPSIVYALRGLAYIEVQVTGPDHDLHSGIYGGAVNNPINALCRMIAKLQDDDGHITIPGFYDNVRDLDPEERAELAKIPFKREEWLREAGVQTDWGEPECTIIERTTARPTLDINGIWGGYTRAGAKTVLPSQAFAKISMRLVPDQKPVEIMRLIENYLAEIAPPSIRIQVRSLHGGKGVIVNRNSPAMQAASRAYAKAFGKEPILCREGGSIPIVAAFREALGIETILMGFGLPDDRLHSPNEKFYLPNFYKGIETAIHFMEILGSEI
jgi:acetylornithine deacetylase/succinyl-diaminopimelate desuccinylase-like protein